LSIEDGRPGHCRNCLAAGCPRGENLSIGSWSGASW
jgi:hypothetical protein